jgi:tetratricopeptide (TPR) repeat protein
VTGCHRRWVLQQLGTLEAKEFLARTRASAVENEAEYRFQHALIRDVAYGGIPRRHRRDMHERTAEWIESLSPDRAVDRADLLAHHYLCAYELAHATGGDTADLAQRARLALRHAGDRALSLQAFPAAARLFRGALELWPDDDPERPWLLFRLGKSIYYAETAGADVLELARDALLAAGDLGTAAEAEAVLAILAHHHGNREEVAGHLERAAALVANLGPTRSKAEVLVDLANHLAIARDDERAIATATEALEIARSTGLPELEASALSIIGLTRGWSGDVRGRDDLEQSIAITEQIGSHLSAHCYALLADLECQGGNLGSCFELQAQARRHAERFGHAGFVRWLTAERVGEGYWTGAWDEALELADPFIAEADAGLPNFMDGYCRTMRGRIRLARGDGAGALGDAGGALEFARTAEDLQMLYPAIAFGARAEVAVGSRRAGAALADELLALWTGNIDAYPASSWTVDLACALESLGRGEELVDVAKGVPAKTRWLEAVIALVVGDPATAAERFRQIGSQPDEALAHLRAARGLLAAGDPRGRTELDAALAFFRRVRADACLRDAEALAGGPIAPQRSRA